jgi:predicted MFS family arabinose efflux permease
MFGSMSEVIPLTTMQRVIPGTALGRVSAVFLTGEAAATLAGAAAGPFLAQAAQFAGAAATASLLTLTAAALTFRTVPDVGLVTSPPRRTRGRPTVRPRSLRAASAEPGQAEEPPTREAAS